MQHETPTAVSFYSFPRNVLAHIHLLMCRSYQLGCGFFKPANERGCGWLAGRCLQQAASRWLHLPAAIQMMLQTEARRASTRVSPSASITETLLPALRVRVQRLLIIWCLHQSDCWSQDESAWSGCNLPYHHWVSLNRTQIFFHFLKKKCIFIFSQVIGSGRMD